MSAGSEGSAVLFPAITQTLRISPITLERKVLLWLLRYPFQRAEDLALALEVDQSTMSRHLSTQCKSGLVEYITPPLGSGNKVHCYYLTQAGILAAAQQELEDAGVLAKRWQVDENGLLRLLPRITHLLAVQQVINGLVAFSPTALASSGGHSARFHWHWRREYSHQFFSHREIISCRADAALVLQQINSPSEEAIPTCSSCLLMVEGIVNLDAQTIRQRLEALLRYRESRERTPFYQHFPPLLVIVHSQHQRAIWQRCVLEAAVARRIKPLQGAIAIVPSAFPTGSMWLLPWRQFAGGSSCRLQQLLNPMPPEALLADIMPTYQEERLTHSRKKILVRGQFTQRAGSLTFQGQKSAYHEREIVALLSLRLNFRHVRLIRLLFTYPLLSASELAAIACMQVETALRYLSDLRTYDCVAKITTMFGTRFLLNKRGLRLVAALHQTTVRHITECKRDKQRAEGRAIRIQRGVLMLQRNLRHTAGIYSFLRVLSHDTVQHEDRQLLWFETGGQSERSYRYQGNWRNFRPDAAFACQIGQDQSGYLVAWLEWDEGSMSMRNLAAKMHEYQRVMRGREWVRYDTKSVPLLLFVVPDKGQEERVVRVARSILSQEGIIVRTTTAARLEKSGPLASIWRPVLPELPGASARQTLLHARMIRH